MLFEVTIINTGERFGCRSDQSLLAAMEQLRRKGIPVGCRNGGCGVCKVRVVRGSYGAAKMSRAVLSQAEADAACTLACKTYPTTAMAVEVVGAMVRAVTAPTRFSFDFTPPTSQPNDKET